MNRITQCIHGKGTVSSMMADPRIKEVRQEFLAYSPNIRPVIFWNLTGRCNLSCDHCYNYSGPNQGIVDELSTSEALSFIDDCGSLRVPVILLSGGEPLMRPEFSELWTDPDNPVLIRFRTKHQQLTGRCGTCSYLDLCGGGCRVRAFRHSGDFSAEDPFCFIRT